MFFLQAAMAPVPVRFKNRQYSVPKMIMDDIITWAVDVRTERVEAQTADMEDAERRQHMAMFPPVEPDLKEIHMLVGTPSGIKKVLRTCLPKAEGRLVKNNKVTDDKVPPLTDQEIEELFSTNPIGRLSGIAWQLLEISDTSRERPQEGGEEKNPT
jgi:hypothetical protein